MDTGDVTRATDETMTVYCLIHGSGQGPDGWKLLVQELERLGDEREELERAE